MHDLRKLALGLTASAACAAVAGSAHAQGPTSSFTYSTTVNNNAAGSTLTTGSGGYVYATGVPGTGSGTPLIPVLSSPQTNLTMANFNVVGDGSGVSAPFTLQLTVHAPILGGTTAPVQDVSTTLHGSFNSVTSTNSFLGVITGADLVTTGNSTYVPFTAGHDSLSYNFGQYGTYTFYDFKYTASVSNTPGQADGTITADEVFTPVPEPGSVAAFAFTGLGMMGLMLRARKGRVGLTA